MEPLIARAFWSKERAMANKALSVSVEERLAKIVDKLAMTEDCSPSQVVALALRLYLQLPPEAHRAFRVVEGAGSERERVEVIRELTRALLNGEFAVTRRQVATTLSFAAVVGDEDEIMQRALQMTRDPQST
jgi:hypothetical protein